jgi:phage terminase large subunit-like protein
MQPTDNMSVAQKKRYLELLKKKREIHLYGGHLHKIFPDEGPLAYYNYPRHMEFFKSGALYKERLFLAANRVGKSMAGAYEVACHATGVYPDWWEGYRFDKPVHVWVAGSTRETTSDAPQKELLGPPGEIGTGMIARKAIKKIEPWHGVAGSAGAAWIYHQPTGGISRIGFKTYDQKRRSFEGTAKHIIWFDEEPPADIYNEALLRTMTTKGMMMSTLTPMQGLTEFIVHFQDTATSFTPEEDNG